MCYLTVSVTFGTIVNMVMRFGLLTQNEVRHQKIPHFVSDLDPKKSIVILHRENLDYI